MATAIAAPSVELEVKTQLETPQQAAANLSEDFEIKLKFQDAPWANTPSVNILTGADRDVKIAKDITELVGHTPLVQLHSLTKLGDATIAAKLESFNPQSSIKDRIALSLIEDAEAQGIIAPGKTTILEVTSGNTGIGLATVGIRKGYRVVCVMPAYYSIERRVTLLALGAEIVVTKAEKGVPGAVEKLLELEQSIPGAWIAGQFTNHANTKVHYETTGPEVWRQTGGKVDVLVAGAGTGGTISGIGRYLKEQNPAIKVVGVEPQESAVISGHEAAPHLIQGLGPGFVPEILDTGLLDEVIPVHSQDAIRTAQKLAKEEGILVGISSGAAAYAAAQVAARPENQGKLIVVVFPSYGERYQSTDLFKEFREIAGSLPHH